MPNFRPAGVFITREKERVFHREDLGCGAICEPRGSSPSPVLRPASNFPLYYGVAPELRPYISRPPSDRTLMVALISPGSGTEKIPRASGGRGRARWRTSVDPVVLSEIFGRSNRLIHPSRGPVPVVKFLYKK